MTCHNISSGFVAGFVPSTTGASVVRLSLVMATRCAPRRVDVSLDPCTRIRSAFSYLGVPKDLCTYKPKYYTEVRR